MAVVSQVLVSGRRAASRDRTPARVWWWVEGCTSSESGMAPARTGREASRVVTAMLAGPV